MRINVDIHNKNLLLRMRRGERRLGFGAVAAIRAGLLAIQRAQRVDVTHRLTVRQTEFVMRQIAIVKPFPSVAQQRPWGEVFIGRKPRLFLTRLEGGGDRPQKFKTSAVPVVGSPARPSWRESVPSEYWITRLDFKRPRRRKRVGREVWEGMHDTFLVPGDGIFQRRGSEVVRLYSFKRRIRLPSRLRWLAIARTVGRATVRETMEKEALTAIGRGGL